MKIKGEAGAMGRPYTELVLYGYRNQFLDTEAVCCFSKGFKGQKILQSKLLTHVYTICATLLNVSGLI